MGRTYTRLLAHIIFSTKDRMPLLRSDIRARVFEYMGGIINELDGSPILINGVDDHVHVLTSMSPATSVSDFVRVLKSNSSKWIREQRVIDGGFAWQNGYGAFSVSPSNEESVREYIQTQETHHKKMTFQEEFIAFLKKHGLEYDERYIWE